jgi:hypothetical protein
LCGGGLTNPLCTHGQKSCMGEEALCLWVIEMYKI